MAGETMPESHYWDRTTQPEMGQGSTPDGRVESHWRFGGTPSGCPASSNGVAGHPDGYVRCKRCRISAGPKFVFGWPVQFVFDLSLSRRGKLIAQSPVILPRRAALHLSLDRGERR